MVDSDMTDPKPKRRWYQFSLRTLLVFVFLVSLPLSWLAVKIQQARERREAVAVFLKAGGQVRYEYQVDEDFNQISGAETPAPAWLGNLLGQDFFSHVVAVTARGHALGNREVAQLERLTDLAFVDLSSTKVTDDGLRHLEGLPKLMCLSLIKTGVTDAGLVHLEVLTGLEYLHLRGTQVTDAGLKRLEGLHKLKFLGLEGTQVTDEGVEKLQKALPNCEIHHWPTPTTR
jgi:hypothetical protein